MKSLCMTASTVIIAAIAAIGLTIGCDVYHDYDVQYKIGTSQCKIVGVQNQLFGGIEKVTKTAYLCGDSLYWR